MSIPVQTHRLTILCVVALLPLTLTAQTVPPPISIQLGPIVTTTSKIDLGYYNPIMTATVVPVPPRPPSRFQIGQRIELVVPAPGAAYGPVQWYKDGVKLSVGSASLVIESAQQENSGEYYAVVLNETGEKRSTNSIQLWIANAVTPQSINQSTLARISATQPFFTLGFVLETPPTSLKVYKAILIRAIGPSLRRFGVTDSLTAPKIQIFDAAGKDVTSQSPYWPLPSQLLQLQQRVGAFPIETNTADVITAQWLPPGAYTVQISSASGGTGAVLAEVYALP
ncbi:MAG: immunoglobulin domain-containing protein [Opitutae bacterium]|nr:immunoglobulin domain-containing protein [Opitutae bacterium]